MKRFLSIILTLLPLLHTGATEENRLKLTIHEAERYLADHNLRLLAEHYAVDQAEARVIQAKLFDNPVISFEQNVYNRINGRYFDFGKEGESSGEKDVVCALFFKFSREFEYGIARSDNIVGYKNIHAHDGASDIFVSDYRIASVNDVGIVPSLVEHTEVEPEYGREIKISGKGALVLRNHHNVVLIQRNVVETLVQGFKNLISREKVVESHKRNGVLNAGIVSVESNYISYAHAFEFLQHHCAVERLS